jgi:hypothetical protein
MTVTLDWFGCTTYRLNIDGLVVLLDTFMDRISSAPDNGVTSADIKEADFAIIGHSHMDHIEGADIIAKNTGAKVIGSYETARVLAEAGVQNDQLLPSAGGELHHLNDDVNVRGFPSLHSCIWSTAAPSGVNLTGDLGVPQGERTARLAANRDDPTQLPPELAAELKELDAMRIGSPGILAGIRADVMIMGCAGRGNIDGEPIQGSVEDYVAGVLSIVSPKRVVLGHHDNWAGALEAPDLTDITPISERLARVAPDIEVIEPGYQDGMRLL